MPDALTESFCERCGTRYEFAAPSRLTPIGRTLGVISGLKNYILSQDSLSDSIGDAMRSHKDVLASKQLDAFHSSFNFCIDCRQYTCTNCWNEDAGRCQSCQPLPNAQGLANQLEATAGESTSAFGIPVGLDAGSDGTRLEDPSWPASDLTEPPLFPLLTLAEPEPEPVVAEPEPEPVAAEVEPEPESEPVAAEVEPEPEPEPVAAEVEPEPYRPLRPIGDSFLHFPRAIAEGQDAAPAASATVGAAASAADGEALAARRAQLNELGLGDPGQEPVQPARPVGLPSRSSAATARRVDRQAEASPPAGGAFWDASAREVAGAISQIGVRSCGHCELSLSATARFCRRCGTPQSQSA